MLNKCGTLLSLRTLRKLKSQTQASKVERKILLTVERRIPAAIARVSLAKGPARVLGWSCAWALTTLGSEPSRGGPFEIC